MEVVDNRKREHFHGAIVDKGSLMQRILKTTLLSCLLATLTACGGGSSNPVDENLLTGNNFNTGNSNPGSNSGGNSNAGSNQGSTKVATLNWSIPSSREDGSPLPVSEIGGYEIYYFMEGDNQSDGTFHTINGATTTTFTTPSLPTGTYYFAIATFDINGISSELSDPIAANLN